MYVLSGIHQRRLFHTPVLALMTHLTYFSYEKYIEARLKEPFSYTRLLNVSRAAKLLWGSSMRKRFQMLVQRGI
jgi:hypothetical protein